MPKVFEFLGYIPFESNATALGEQIKAYRIREGLSLRKMAKILEIDPGTLAKWEKGNRVSNHLMVKRIIDLLAEEKSS